MDLTWRSWRRDSLYPVSVPIPRYPGSAADRAQLVVFDARYRHRSTTPTQAAHTTQSTPPHPRFHLGDHNDCRARYENKTTSLTYYGGPLPKNFRCRFSILLTKRPLISEEECAILLFSWREVPSLQSVLALRWCGERMVPPNFAIETFHI